MDAANKLLGRAIMKPGFGADDYMRLYTIWEDDTDKHGSDQALRLLKSNIAKEA